ncbi:M16 family metallopeptidase [Sinomicrobium soli]|uniref:M16 family metallopeptidase n=1 Tax=Sinomicrobium sp. N-1-3-6 TaxID=2219864 RepID=UPI000DCDF673|nr:insulinase family protein [Sinomicrobium sp. N-1-3-6]RAV29210.1 hypothetical protein DN748_09840 [Sinomicrobium sp. N-1-3-6]
MVIKLSIHIKKNARSLILALVVGLFFRVEVVPQGPEDFPMLDSLPLNPEITYGKLDNGFTYYICKRDTDGDEVLMEFLVKGGTRDEDIDQKQVAHAIEHVPFYKTKQYPKGIWEAENKSKLGINKANVSANTPYDYTRYYFNFQKENTDSFKEALLWFREIAANLRFDLEIINHVTDEVFEEVRYRTKGKMAPSGNSYRSRIFPGVKKLSDLDKSLKEHTPEVFQRFYNDWYRPENMAVFIVGNIFMDKDEIIKQVKSHFSDLEKVFSLRQKRDFASEYLNQEEKRIFIRSSNISTPEVRLYFRLPRSNRLVSKADFQEDMYKRVIIELLHNRIMQLGDGYMPIARGIHTKLHEDYPVFAIGMQIDTQNMLNVAVKEVIKEIKIAQQYGFSPKEFEQVKKQLKQEILAKKKVHQATLIEECKNHFLTGAAFPEDKTSMLLGIIDTMDMSFIRKKFAQLFTPAEALDFVFLSPGQVDQYNGDMVDEWIAEAWQSKVHPFKKHTEKISSLMGEVKKNSLKEQPYQLKEVKQAGITEVTFDNGVKVVLKKFQPKGLYADKIMFHGFSPGGATIYAKGDYYSAINAGEIISHSGVNGMNKFNIEGFLPWEENRVQPYINNHEEGIKGRCDKERLEDVLQLIHLYFTTPNKDKRAFEDWKLRYPAYYSRFLNNYQRLSDTIASTFGNSNHISFLKRLKYLDKTNFERAYQIYKERFANAGDFTFVFTGDFKLEEILPQISKYLGSLPDTERRDKFKMKEYEMSKGPHEKVIVQRKDYTGAIVKLCFVDNYPLSTRGKVIQFVMARALKNILQRRLRYQDEANTFITTVTPIDKGPNWHRLDIKFECAAENIDRLIAMVWEELVHFRDKGISEIEFEQAVDLTQSYFYMGTETSNQRVLDELVQQYKNKEAVVNTFALQNQYIKEIKPYEIDQLAKRTLQKKNYFPFVLRQVSEIMKIK